MAKSKKEKFDKDDIRLARIAKALAHPARIAIMRHLALMNECCFNEISKELPLADSTVSQHMSELKSAGLVLGSFEPPKIKYCINAEGWKQARKLLKGFTKIKPVKDSDE
ncbi:MAG: metalloregulator ArsR/SmtB family transcription factor [Nitrospirae bacterium]|jgi:DNA-binding transcriptional ArsR family regulator|nr:metalloregulator ArsR/SmtB family transcription factor [Nitrospirota bacterium]